MGGGARILLVSVVRLTHPLDLYRTKVEYLNLYSMAEDFSFVFRIVVKITSLVDVRLFHGSLSKELPVK